jgi:hypothetical protein
VIAIAMALDADEIEKREEKMENVRRRWGAI